MRILISLILAVLLCMMSDRCSSMTPTELSKLYTDIFVDYDSELLPLKNQSTTATVGMTFSMFGITDFDEISGTIAIGMMVLLSWNEERISWNPNDYSGKTSIIISPSKIWHPQLYLFEAADKFEDLADISMKPRLQHNGSITWMIGMMVHATCSLDVTYFPFDTQYCELRLSTAPYFPSELTFNALSAKIDTTYFTQNNQWKVLESSVVNNASIENMPTLVQVSLHLERRVAFPVVYIIIPTVFLSSLNVLVFAMPVNSGERQSVATTMFLSFVVYMQIANDHVPESSKPVSLFYYYLLFLIIYSSCIMLLSVISLRIHNKTSEVPSKVQLLVQWISGIGSSNRKAGSKVKPVPQLPYKQKDTKDGITVEDVQYDQKGADADELENNETNTERDEYTSTKSDDGIQWDEVGKVFDFSCLAFLILVNFVVSFLTLDNLINHRY